jgi:hypothetical protein
LGTFTGTGNMTTGRFGHTATLLSDGQVLIVGGTHDRGPDRRLARSEIYDPSTGVFTVTGDMITARSFHTATLLPNGKVLVAGGSQEWSSLSSAEVYDPAVGTFTATHEMSTARSFHTANLLHDGRVLIVGGGDYAGSDVAQSSAAELYDFATGRFAVTGSMAATQLGPTATLLADGGVLVASPNFYPFELVAASKVKSIGATGEVYSLLTESFSRISEGDGMFLHHSATLLPGGKVLLAGGACYLCGVVLASAMLYDPASGRFTATGLMSRHRSWHAATLLPDGTVLLTGGTSTILGSPVASAEVYAPLTGTFGTAGTMTTGRRLHAATLLNNGDVLITGGFGIDRDRRDEVLGSAELYHLATLLPVQGRPPD